MRLVNNVSVLTVFTDVVFRFSSSLCNVPAPTSSTYSGVRVRDKIYYYEDRGGI